MAISDRLSDIRQLLPGARPPPTDERLLQLYWNRAELKKELSRLQDEQHSLVERMNEREASAMRAREQLEQLENYLGNPDVAMQALVYFQLRALWRACSTKLARFAAQLRRQQEERERQRQLIEFDQERRRQLAELDRAILDARAAADTLDAKRKLKEAALARMHGFWNYFRRRELVHQLEAERVTWDDAVMRVTDLSDDRHNHEATQPPAFAGISVDGRRIVNTAVIAYAQQLAAALSSGGLALLAKETTTKPVFDIKYGGREECVRLMALLREAVAVMGADKDDLTALKERTDALRAGAVYRSDADTVPFTDSIGVLPVQATPVSGLETANRAGINVLVDDYWDLYQALVQ
jgi:hypothetical protein